TAMGVGADYNEDLLEAMAKSGDGNYYYIESPAQLADIFQTELQGLMATVGRSARLEVEPLGGVEVADVLNDLERDPSNRLVLPNLIVGMPVEIVLRLQVPPRPEGSELCRVRASWTDAQGAEQRLEASLTLPPVSGVAWATMASNLDVQERTALLL